MTARRTKPVAFGRPHGRRHHRRRLRARATKRRTHRHRARVVTRAGDGDGSDATDAPLLRNLWLLVIGGRGYRDCLRRDCPRTDCTGYSRKDCPRTGCSRRDCPRTGCSRRGCTGCPRRDCTGYSRKGCTGCSRTGCLRWSRRRTPPPQTRGCPPAGIREWNESSCRGLFVRFQVCGFQQQTRRGATIPHSQPSARKNSHARTFCEAPAAPMTAPQSVTPCSLDDARALLTAGETLLTAALGALRRLCEEHGADAQQVLTERVAYAATEVRAARDVLALAASADEHAHADAMLEATAIAATGELMSALVTRLAPAADELGLGDRRARSELPRRHPGAAARGARHGGAVRNRPSRHCATRALRAAGVGCARTSARERARIRGERSRAARRAHSPWRRRRARRADSQHGRARLLRALHPRSLRRARARQRGDAAHHRGTFARVAGGGGLADYAPRNSRQGAARRRQRGAEKNSGCRSSRRAK